GADLSETAELGAMAGEIARTLAQLTTLRVYTVGVLLGQGCGGGARARLPPLPPEGARPILFGPPDRAADMARRQRVGALDLAADGIVHHVVAERQHDKPESLCRAVAAEVAAQLRAGRQ